MEKLPTHELTIEELTAEAMQLLTVGLEELYVVLGCQLMGAARPARVAGLVSHQSALRNVVAAQRKFEPAASGAALMEWGKNLNSMVEELRDDGIRFVAAAAEELSNGLSGKDLLHLLNEITSSSMQVIVLIVAAVLKLPRQIEAVCATVAAIFCKSALTELSA